MDHRRHGPPQTRTARRSVPTSEPGRHTRTARRSVPTSEVIGLHPGFPLQTRPHPDTSEVGRFLRKRRSGEHGIEAPVSLASTIDGELHRAGPLGDRSLPQSKIGTRGPLGDRSLPRRSLGYILGSRYKLGLTVGTGRILLMFLRSVLGVSEAFGERTVGHRPYRGVRTATTGRRRRCDPRQDRCRWPGHATNSGGRRRC